MDFPSKKKLNLMGFLILQHYLQTTDDHCCIYFADPMHIKIASSFLLA